MCTREESEEEYPSKKLYMDPNGVLDPAVPADIDAAVTSLIALSGEHDKGIALDLHGANLEGAAFGAGFRGADSRANYKPTYLYNTNLQYASLIGVSMLKADFTDTNLRGANIGNADLSGANFQSAHLSNATIGGTALAYNEFVNLREANFQEANLYEADFQNVNLRGANFRGTKMKRALLCGVDLQGAKNLTQEQLDATEDGAHVRLLPEGLHSPSLWSKTNTMRGTHGYCLH